MLAACDSDADIILSDMSRQSIAVRFTFHMPTGVDLAARGASWTLPSDSRCTSTCQKKIIKRVDMIRWRWSTTQGSRLPR